MNTKSQPYFRYLLFAVLVVVFSASMLRAETIKGKFTLPFQTDWGVVVLAPGEYTFQLDTTGRDPMVLRSNGRSWYVIFGYSDKLNGPANSKLLVVHVGQKPRVQMLYVAGIGTAFHFWVPTRYEVNTRVITEASEPALVEEIPIEICRK